MASEIRVNKLNSSTGVGTITLSPTGVDISGVTTVSTLKVGTGVTASEDGDIFATGVCTATSFSGDGSSLTGIAATDNVRTGILDVAGVGTFRGDVNIPDKIIHLGDTDTAIRFPAADTVSVETGGSERLRIDSNGLIANNARVPSSYGSPNLLISGTDSTLTLMGDGSSNNSSFTGIKFRVAGASSGDYTKAGIFAQRQGSYNDLALIFSLDTAADATSVAISDEKLRIGSSGQIGIAGANYGTSGQVITSQGSGSAVQWATPATATSGTYTSVGTGYYKDITTTSTNVVKYDIMFTGVSIGGGMAWQFQLGDSGGVESSGYNTVSAYRSHNGSNQTDNPSNAFRWHGIGDASFIMDGRFTLTRIHNNKWFGEGLLVRTEGGSTIYDMIGSKELSGALTTIRISSSYDDSEVFDGGHYKVIEYTGTV